LVSSAVKQSARESDTWSAWAADSDRLLKVASCIDTCFALPRTRSAAREDESGDGSPLNGSDLAVELVARHEDLDTETVGPPSEVLRDIERVGLQVIQITAGTRRGMNTIPPGILDLFAVSSIPRARDAWFVGVTLSKRTGVTLHVHGSDPAWVRSTFNELRSEIQKGVPWWSWIRHSATWPAFFCFGVLATGIGVAPWLEHRWWAWAVATVGGGVVLGSLGLFLARRALPGLEVLTPGQRGRGLAVLSVCGGLVGQVLVGVLLFFATNG
jgi:hypothetical protein